MTTETEAWKHAFPELRSPRRFREGKREGENGTCCVFCKTPQSAKVREGSAKGNAKLETCMSKHCSPRRFHEVKREGDFKSIIRVSVTFLEQIQGYHNEHVVCMRTKPASQPSACPAWHVFSACPCTQHRWIAKMG